MTNNTATAWALTANELPRLLTIEEVADHLGVTVRHVRRLVSERRIPFLKWGHLLRFDPTQIATWLTAQRVPVADHSGSPSRAGQH